MHSYEHPRTPIPSHEREEQKARETNSRFCWRAEIKATALLPQAIFTLKSMALGPLPQVRLSERIGLDEVVVNRAENNIDAIAVDIA
ncbi:hypothetical protein BCON_0429g00030 [Botryotinia convoluta]|uniref:Uncharacterized protein n=1 Tax=Botryotinia convoluta TaxID=54673 RepID=A0A4Z1HJ60_9HELO|nr:hypothetical protein BCON_0429g00030 [Botryotinia convoluta]